MVSTVASGGTPPVRRLRRRDDDVLGRRHLRGQPVSARIMANAAGALAGMAGGGAAARRGAAADRRLDVRGHYAGRDPARERLEELGYEVLVFHQTGAGGGSMEGLIKAGFIAGSLDIDDDRVLRPGRGRRARGGPERLESAGGPGIPQVVSLGALDMVNFGPMDCARALPRAEPVRPQPDHHADADDSRGVPRDRGIVAGKLNAADRADGALRAAARRLDDRHRGPAVPRPGGRRGAVRRCASSSTRRRSRCTRSTPDVNDPASRWRWPIACTS